MRFISHQAPISFPGDTFGSADKIPMLQHSAHCGDNQFMQAPYQKWMNKGWMHSRRGINKRSYFHSPEAGPFSLSGGKRKGESHVWHVMVRTAAQMNKVCLRWLADAFAEFREHCRCALLFQICYNYSGFSSQFVCMDLIHIALS